MKKAFFSILGYFILQVNGLCDCNCGAQDPNCDFTIPEDCAGFKLNGKGDCWFGHAPKKYASRHARVESRTRTCGGMCLDECMGGADRYCPAPKVLPQGSRAAQTGVPKAYDCLGTQESSVCQAIHD